MTRPVRVLIVDSMRVREAALAASLADSGRLPDWTSVRSAAEFVEALADQPELIIAHVQAGAFDAAAVRQLLDERALDIPLVVVSEEAGGETVQPANLGAAATRVLAQHQTMAELRRSRQDFETLVNAVDGIVWEMDAPSLRFTFVSRQAERLLGYPIRQWLAEPDFWTEHVHPADRDQAMQLCTDATSALRAHELEYRMIAADGRIVWVRDLVTVSAENGMPRTLRGVIIDVTARKQAEASEREQRLLAEALRDTAAALNSTLNFDELLDRILFNVGWVVPHDSANIMLVEDATAYIVRSHVPADQSRQDSIIGMRFPIDGLPNLRQMRDSGRAIVIADTGSYPGWVDFPQTDWIRSCVGAPIRLKGKLLGFLHLDSLTPGFFTDKHAEQLQAFAEQAATALENARLLSEVEQRVDAFALLYETTRDLATDRDLPDVLDTIVERGMALLQASSGCMLLFDAEQQELQVAVARGNSRWPVGRRLPLDRGMAGRVAMTRQPLMVDDYSRWPERTLSHDGPPIGAVLEVPMLYRGQLIGVLVVYEPRRQKPVFTEDDVRLLSLFAAHAASAVYDARLLAQTRRQLFELEAVNRLSTALRGAQAIDELLPRFLETALEIVHSSDGAVLLFDLSRSDGRRGLTSGWFTRLAIQPSHPHFGIAGHVVATGELYRTHDFATDPRTYPDLRPLIPAAQSGVVIPLRAAREIVGLFFIAVPLPRELSDDEIRLLTTLCEIAGNAIHRMRLFEQTERRLRYLNALHIVDTAISSSFDLRTALGVLLEQLTSQLGIDAALVLQLNPNSQTLEYVYGKGFRAVGVSRLHFTLSNSVAGRAAFERRTLTEQDSALRSPEIAQWINEEQFTGYWAVPLLAKGQPRGVLEIFRRSPLKTDAEWLQFLEAVAGQAAIAVENAEMFGRLQRSNAQLSIAYDSTLEGWSRALDLRDKETEGHTQRVAELSVRLARAVGLSETEIVDVRRGALLHDIGKMGIPDSILLKPGPLTEEEWVVMRKHPVYAYEMLAPIAYLRGVLDIPYGHHEQWDGSGYPRGLKGEQIPLMARIFAVVDVWDALCSDRPYRKAWPAARVREHIRQLSGTHFDPQVVDAFLRIVSEPN